MLCSKVHSTICFCKQLNQHEGLSPLFLFFNNMRYGMDKNTPTKRMDKLFDEYENELLTKARTEKALESTAMAQVSKLIDSIKKKLNNGKR